MLNSDSARKWISLQRQLIETWKTVERFCQPIYDTVVLFATSKNLKKKKNQDFLTVFFFIVSNCFETLTSFCDCVKFTFSFPIIFFFYFFANFIFSYFLLLIKQQYLNHNFNSTTKQIIFLTARKAGKRGQ